MDSLEARVAVLESEIAAINRLLQDRTTIQDSRHRENSQRLVKIENTMREIAVYFKIGRWVMHAVWMIAGSGATVMIMKWLGVKP